MSKIQLETVTTPLNSSSFQQQINNNFSKISTSLDKQLQRVSEEGVVNTMQNDLDMNSNRIINLPEPVADTEAARFLDIKNVKPYAEAAALSAQEAEDSALRASASAASAATSAQAAGVSANAAANSAQEAGISVEGFDAHVNAKTAAFDANAAEKTLLIAQYDANVQANAEAAATSETEAANSAAEAMASEEMAEASATTATTQAGIATAKATEAANSATSASNSATSANNSATTATNAMNSATTSAQTAATWAEGTDSAVQALGGEHSSKNWATVCSDIAARLGTTLNIKGRVDTIADLPTTGNVNGDMYFVGTASSTYKDEYVWFLEAGGWELFGTAEVDLSDYYTKGQTNTALNLKADKSTTYTKTEVDTDLATKQDTLVSGTSIKTINNESLLGSGDITISADTSDCVKVTEQTFTDTQKTQARTNIGAGTLSNTGTGNNALGILGTASGEESLAIGSGSSATQMRSMSIGNSQASAAYSLAIGSNPEQNAQCKATGQYSVAICGQALGDYSLAIGIKRDGSSTRSGAYAANTGSVAINGYAAGNYTTALGSGTLAWGEGSVAVGYGAGNQNGQKQNTTAIGYQAWTFADWATQIGQGTNSEANSVYMSTSASNNWKLLDNTGKIPAARLPDTPAASGIQLSFDGTYENGVLTFEHTPAYSLEHNKDYGIDLRFSAVGELPESTPIRIMNGTTEVKIKNILNIDTSSTATWKEMRQLQHYNTETGYGWDFFARCKIIDGAYSVFISPTVSNVETFSDRIQDALLDNPNLIQYTSTSNSLTILAGSTLVFPDGTDGFTKYSIGSSMTASSLPTTGQIIFADTNQLYYINAGQVFAGTTAPTGYTMMLWYDSTNNMMKYSGDSGTTWTGGYSLPIGIGSSTTGIQECFCNGFFYFAGCQIVLDGVRVSIPNGKTSTGTFKNIQYCVQEPIVNIRTDTYEGQWAIRNNGTLYYSTSFTIGNDNTVKDANGDTILCCPMGDFKITTGVIDKADVREVFSISGELDKKADVDLSNTGMITNCILSAPNGVATYSGAVVTAKSGLSVLIPNGRNVDGTLNNIEYTTSSDITYTISTTNSISGFFMLSSSGELFWIALKSEYYVNTTPPFTPTANKFGTWYNPEENKTYRSWNGEAWTQVYWVLIADITITNGTITSLTPEQPIDLLKYSDREMVVGWGIPDYSRIFSIGVGAFTAPYSGRVFIEIINTNGGSTTIFSVNGNAFGYIKSDYNNHHLIQIDLKKGDVLTSNTYSYWYEPKFAPFLGV